jgi:hypothetical protein
VVERAVSTSVTSTLAGANPWLRHAPAVEKMVGPAVSLHAPSASRRRKSSGVLRITISWSDLVRAVGGW